LRRKRAKEKIREIALSFSLTALGDDKRKSVGFVAVVAAVRDMGSVVTASLLPVLTGRYCTVHIFGINIRRQKTTNNPSPEM
jgi:hypothetical protein